MPKVSIVLPTYNGERFITTSIESVLNQTFKDWELIIVNDCSTDNTPTIIQKYENMDQRIRVIHNKTNQKLPNSLNIGFRAATGEYYTWTSDDNLYLPDAIEKLVDYIDADKSEAMVCAKILFLSENGEYQGISRKYDAEWMCYSNCVGACFLYRKDAALIVGEYNTELFLVEDYEYWLRILFRYKKIGFIDEVLYIYRNQSKSLTFTRKQEILYKSAMVRAIYIDNIMMVLENRKDYLCRIFYNIKCFYKMDAELREKFVRRVKVLAIDNVTKMEEKVIVYGAGMIGRHFASKHKNKILFFADRDPCKIGSKMEGIEVISLDRMKKLSNDYQVAVAAGMDNIYDFLVTLNNLDIHSCYVYKDAWGEI